MANNRKLGRVSSHRKAMLRNLATDVIMHGKIETTATRAKEVRKVVDKLTLLVLEEIFMLEDRLLLFFRM